MNKIASLFLTVTLLVGLFIGTASRSYANSAALQTGTCANLITNGDMQGDTGWNLNAGPVAAQYVTDGRDDSKGVRGLRIGPTGDPARKGQRWSSALQKVTLPAAGPLSLSFWYRYEPDASAPKDSIQVALLDDKSNVLTFLFKETDYRNVWRQFSADVSQYAGRDVQIFFAVESDGATGKTHLLIDNVQLCDPKGAALQPTTAAAAATVAPTVAATVAPVAPTTAATTAPATVGDAAAPAANLTPFSQLGIADQTLRKPYDTASVTFGLPADWKVGDGAAVQLDLTTFFNSGTGKVDPARLSGSTLDASFNGTALASVPLDQIGTRVIPLPIPADAFATPASNGLHTLLLTLKSGPNCNVDQQVGVIVRATSGLQLPHTSIAPSTDLATLPRPIFQNSFAKDVATIVVPDKPTAAELEAALSVAAALGRMTDGKLTVSLAPVAKITPELQQANSMIFVGKPAGLPILSGAQLPAPITGGSFKAANATPSDGVVQMAASPWNASKVLLVIGGGDDAAVTKAGKAFSSGTIRGGAQPNVAVVADVQAATAVANVAADRSFASLGYGATKLSGIGEHRANFRFDIPAGQSVSSDAYIDLVLNHSSLLDYERSSAMFTLNGQPIRGLRFGDDTASVNTLRLSVPASAVRSGSNELSLLTRFVPQIACSTSSSTDLWMTIWPESTTHLPLSASTGNTASHFDLSSYPQPFWSSATLDNTAFVLAQNDSAAWDVAAQLAFNLGTNTSSQVVGLTAAYADAIPDAVRKERSLLVIGQPQALPIVSELKDALPLPFEANSNTAAPRSSAVTYRTASDAKSGYLEVLPAPWNADNAVLMVLGGTEEGLRQAANALVAADTTQSLSGNVAVVGAGQISSTTAAAADTAAPSAPADTAASPVTVATRPWWIVPAIGVAAALMLAIIAFVTLTSRRQKVRLRP